GVTRTGVPGARHDALVVDDCALIDVDPVSERPAGRLVEAVAQAIGRPSAGIPFRIVLNAIIASPHVIGEALYTRVHRLDQDLGLDGAGGDPAKGGEQRLGP